MTETGCPIFYHQVLDQVYCTQCGQKLEVTVMTDHYDAHTGDPVFHILRRCPEGHQIHRRSEPPSRPPVVLPPGDGGLPTFRWPWRRSTNS